MKKTNVYRGIRYNANDMKPESKQKKEGTYRGVKWKEESQTDYVPCGVWLNSFMKAFYTGILQGIIVLVPTYTVAYLTDKMVYTIPMLAAASFVAASINKQPVERKVDDVSKDLGKEQTGTRCSTQKKYLHSA